MADAGDPCNVSDSRDDMYVKLARREEREVLEEFGEEYRHYMDSTPAFIPHFGGHRRLNEA